jgi:hypothetical protein
MKRITISLPDEVAAALGREAARRRVSVSQVAREAIESRLGWVEDGPREIPFAALGSGPGNVAERVDEILAHEWADAILGDR